MFDSVALTDVVPHLPVATLQQLVHWRGIDGMGEVLAAALVLTVLSWAIFVFGLGLTIPVAPWWLGR